MRDDEQRLGVGLELVDERVEPREDVKVRLAARVPVGELVGLARLGLVRRVSRVLAECQQSVSRVSAECQQSDQSDQSVRSK